MQMQTAMNPADNDDPLPREAPSPDMILRPQDRAVPAKHRIPALRHVLASYPNSAPHWLQLGFAHLAAGEAGRAELAFRAALRVDARQPAAQAGLARALMMQGRCIEAVHECCEGLAADPASMQLHQGLAESFMQAGLFEQAGRTVRAAAALDGGGVDSSALSAAFLFWQNRIGDCLDILEKVLKSAPHHAAARQLQAAAQAAAARTSPGAGATPPQPQATTPSRWQELLQSWKGLKVGLAWADHRPLADALLRSLPLIEYAPLGGLAGVTFFSLQQGAAAREIAQPPEDMECVPLSDALSSPLECAAVLRQMDLVIAVDGDVARAAAELGCRTWILLPEQARAFWGGAEDETPAYPNVRLFRQKRRGQWQPVLRNAADALQALVAAQAAGQLDHAQRQHFAARAACEQSRHAEAARLYRELLANHGGRLHQISSAVRKYMDRCRRYDLAYAAPPPQYGAADTLCQYADLAAWTLARCDQREKAFTIWEKLSDTGMPALSVLMHYGEEAQQARDWERAIGVWEKAMALYPDASQPPLRAADCYQEKGQTGKAVACLQRSLALSPCQPETHHRLGCLLRDQDEKEQALRHMQLAVYLDPSHAHAWLNLAHLLYVQNKQRASAICFERANALQPSHYAVLHLGYCAFNLKEYESAVASLNEALRYEPNHQDALFYKAQSLTHLERHQEAIDVLAAMRAANPVGFDSNESYRKHLFIECLQQSRHGSAAAWSDVYWSGRTLSGTRWRGEPLHGKTLLVFQDSGFGDSLQAARYLPRLKPDCGAGKVIVAVWPELPRLYKTIPGIDAVHSIFDVELEKVTCDYYVDEYSLLLLLGTAFGPAPDAAPYLKPDPELAAAWRARFAADRNVRIGIAWAGSAGHPNDRHRSLSLQDLLPLSDLPDASFYAMQKGPAVSQAYELPELRMVTVDTELTDFADTAALMSTLDLVISVDSAPAHLAGALGVPVWVLVPAVGTDWRWHKDRSDMPWYPAMRLFHQAPGERWSDVVARVHEALARLIAQQGGGATGGLHHKFH
jgi:tetratricopeptide (TPR) repeat protein